VLVGVVVGWWLCVIKKAPPGQTLFLQFLFSGAPKRPLSFLS